RQAAGPNRAVAAAPPGAPVQILPPPGERAGCGRSTLSDGGTQLVQVRMTAAIQLSQATVRKVNRFPRWAAIYNVVAIPVAAGGFYPTFGQMPRAEFGALATSASSITVLRGPVASRSPRQQGLCDARP